MISNDLAADMTADKIGSQFNYFQPPEFLGDVVQAGIGAMEKIPSEQDMIDFYRGIFLKRLKGVLPRRLGDSLVKGLGVGLPTSLTPKEERLCVSSALLKMPK